MKYIKRIVSMAIALALILTILNSVDNIYAKTKYFLNDNEVKFCSFLNELYNSCNTDHIEIKTAYLSDINTDSDINLIKDSDYDYVMNYYDYVDKTTPYDSVKNSNEGYRREFLEDSIKNSDFEKKFTKKTITYTNYYWDINSIKKLLDIQPFFKKRLSDFIRKKGYNFDLSFKWYSQDKYPQTYLYEFSKYGTSPKTAYLVEDPYRTVGANWFVYNCTVNRVMKKSWDIIPNQDLIPKAELFKKIINECKEDSVITTYKQNQYKSPGLKLKRNKHSIKVKINNANKKALNYLSITGRETHYKKQYAIVYSKNKSLKNAKMILTKKTNATIKKLKSHTKYYLRVFVTYCGKVKYISYADYIDYHYIETDQLGVDFWFNYNEFPYSKVNKQSKLYKIKTK